MVEALNQGSEYFTDIQYEDFRSKVYQAFEKCINDSKKCVEVIIAKERYLSVVIEFCRELGLIESSSPSSRDRDCKVDNLEINELRGLLSVIKEVKEKKSFLADSGRQLCMLFYRDIIIDKKIDINDIDIETFKKKSEDLRDIIVNRITDKKTREIISECIEEKIERMLGCYFIKLEPCELPDMRCVKGSIEVEIYPCVFASYKYNYEKAPEIKVEDNRVILYGYKIIEWNYLSIK